MHQPSEQTSQIGVGYEREVASRPSLGTINVIYATLSHGEGSLSGFMSVALKLELEEWV